MAENKTKKTVDYKGLGRRKSSVARVTIVANGTGKITVNKLDVKDYFPSENIVTDIKNPFVVTKTVDQFDVIANIKGGGFSGQAGALRHGIARALVLASEDYRKSLKENNYLKRDARVKERKKYGFKKSRKSPQFSKR